ncbi:Cytosine deaminase [hydrothermal vent metagenome]|uniref:Cytosine deaminase n=1 Tax=hydrothermal vent metagenome TaxID=652676 RepID=A0A3B0XXJ1_9ZZZZ
MEFGVWSLEFGVWSLEFGVWSLEFGVWSLEILTLLKASNYIENSMNSSAIHFHLLFVFNFFERQFHPPVLGLSIYFSEFSDYY